MKSGSLEVFINGKLIKQLSPGDTFGELALINDAPRSATIRTKTISELWGLDRDTF